MFEEFDFSIELEDLEVVCIHITSTRYPLDYEEVSEIYDSL